MRRVFLLRHGHSTFQETHEVTHVDPGIVDAPLSGRGRAQVVAAARERCAPRPRPRRDVAAHPRHRDRPRRRGRRGHPDPRRRPRARAARLRLRRRALARGARDAYPTLDFAHLPEVWWHQGPEDERSLPIEPRELLQSRVDRFRGWLAGRQEERILVVSHSGFLRYLSGERLDNCVLHEWTAAPPPGGVS